MADQVLIYGKLGREIGSDMIFHVTLPEYALQTGIPRCRVYRQRGKRGP